MNQSFFYSFVVNIKTYLFFTFNIILQFYKKLIINKY